MSDPELARGDIAFEPPQALLLTGEGLSRLTPDRLATLSEMVGGLGLRVTAITDVENIGAALEEEPQPVPVTRDDFCAFAEEQGYTVRRGRLVWNTVRHTASLNRKSGDDPYPPVRLLGDTEHPAYTPIVDLRSIAQRLAASGMSETAWHYLEGGRHGHVAFMARLVNDRLQLEEPLPIPPERRSS